MDPFEEFQFKPLTDGLGFHKKADKIKQDIKEAELGETLVSRQIPEMPEALLDSALDAPRVASQSISELISALPPSLDFLDDKIEGDKISNSTFEVKNPFLTPSSKPKAAATEPARPQIFKPLPREEGDEQKTKATASAMSSVVAATEASVAAAATFNSNSTYQAALDESFARAFPRVDRPKAQVEEASAGLVKIPASFAAAILDGMVTLGMSILFLVCILLITKVDLMALLGNAQTDGPTQFHLGVLFMAVLHLYMLITRSIGGATIGEWAFDLQLGDERAQKNAFYPLMVTWRTVLMTLTGLVVLPLLSFIVRRDLASYLTGLQLYRKA